MPGIIFADRDTQYAAILRRTCEVDQIPFVSLSDGKSLPALLESVRPDVLLFSLRVESVDGFDLMNQLQGMDVETPCVILTDLADIADVQRCRALGCKAYFIKRHTKPEQVFSYLQGSGYVQGYSVLESA